MRARLTVRVTAADLTIEQAGEEPRTLKLSNDLETPARSAEALQAAKLPQGSRVTLILSDELLQHRTLEGLPRVRHAVLKQIVQDRQGQFFRLRRGRLTTDARWERDLEGSLLARAVGVEDALVEGLIEGVIAQGCHLSGIQDDKRHYTLIPPSHDAAIRGRELRRLRTLLLIMFAAWLAVAASYIAYLHRTERALDATLLRLREPAAAVRALKARMRRVEQMNAALSLSLRESASLTRTVASIIVALPDSAYLTSLTVDADGTASIAGAAREPAEVQAALERGTRLSAIRSEEAGTFGDGVLGRRWVRFDLRAGQP